MFGRKRIEPWAVRKDVRLLTGLSHCKSLVVSRRFTAKLVSSPAPRFFNP